MATGLAILALSLGIAAVAVAIASDFRTRKSTRELAREIVALRARLQHVQREGALDEDRAPVADDAAEALASINARLAELEELEGRLRGVLARRPMPADELTTDGDDPTAQVLRGLRAQGYERVVVLDVRKDGSLLVEAEQGGLVAKGVARPDADGGITLDSVSSVRAFP